MRGGSPAIIFVICFLQQLTRVLKNHIHPKNHGLDPPKKRGLFDSVLFFAGFGIGSPVATPVEIP